MDAPNRPQVVVAPMAGYVAMTIGNPPPTGGRPPATYNDVFRRAVDGGEWVRIAAGLGNSEDYDDYNVGSDILYEYKARAYAWSGTSADSTPPREAAVHLEGVWLHDLEDPAGTLRHFRYKAGDRSETYGSEIELLHFAGRRFPVADYGEHGTRGIAVRVLIPHGHFGVGYLRSVVDRRGTVVYRDNRGRVVFGVLHELAFGDVVAGTTASFRVDRVDHQEAV